MNDAFKLFHWLFPAICSMGVGNGESEIGIGITIVQVINRTITSFHLLKLKSTTSRILYYKNLASKKKVAHLLS